MKKVLVLLLSAVLCLCAACALAGDYGEAVIDAGNADRVHLREEATTESRSLGLYFTGTKVECKSSPRGDWVDVKIGRERGYIKSRYLKTGNAADRVTPRFKKGTVTAKNWGRLRAGPSTEYNFICKVNNGQTVTIMGETAEHWYYVKAGKEIGFISSSLVRMGTEATGQSGPSGASSSSNTSDWRRTYWSWVSQNGQASYRYSLIDVNRDSIPELAVDTGIEADGCRILTFSNGRLGKLQTRRRGFTYIPGGNRLCNADGSMDYYYDDVYTLENGAWRCVASGEYYGYKDGWSEAQGRYICQTYVWNGTPTSMEEYLLALERVYPQSAAVSPMFEYSHDAILNVLN